MTDASTGVPTAGTEVERIRSAYARRDGRGASDWLSPALPGGLFVHQERERRLLAVLRETLAGRSLASLDILEVGCGGGGNLLDLVRYGADVRRLHGVDLLPDRIAKARAVLPAADLHCVNAESLPFADGRFDLVLSFTVYSSILDAGMRRRVAAEMARVLKPGGAVIWYDYFMNNPRNPDVRGVRRGDIRDLFPGFTCRLRRVTVAPPLVRAIAPYSVLACDLLARVPLLMTHYIGVLVRQEEAVRS